VLSEWARVVLSGLESRASLAWSSAFAVWAIKFYCSGHPQDEERVVFFAQDAATLALDLLGREAPSRAARRCTVCNPPEPLHMERGWRLNSRELRDKIAAANAERAREFRRKIAARAR